MIKTLLLTALLATSVRAGSFVSEGNGIRNTAVGQIKGTPVLFVSEIDGAVGCYKTDGTKLWHHPTEEPAVMFEIIAADIDDDGRDDLLAASGDGNIHCWNSNGSKRWKFNPGHKVRFSEIAVIGQGKVARIFAGGNDYTLYELDAEGALLSETPVEGVVRLLAGGNFLNKNKESLFVMTYTHDKFRWEFMGMLDPKTKKVQRSFNNKKAPRDVWGSLMVNKFSAADIDKDGRDDLLFFGHNTPAVFVGLNGEFEQLAHFAGNRKHSQRYAHGIGICLLPVRDEIVLQYGGVLYVCDLEGNKLGESGERYGSIIYNDFAMDAENGLLLGGGQIGGDNTVYTYNLKEDDWWKAEQTLGGRGAEVEANLDQLYKQALNFIPPSYQKTASKPWVMITGIDQTPEVEKLNGAEMVMVEQINMKQIIDRPELVAIMGKEHALKKDKRMRYDMTQEDIVELARQRERDGQPFVSWVGHGNDPFIVPIDTLEMVLDAAPTTCYGFIYAEMHNPQDPRVQHFTAEYVPRLAKAIRKNGNRAKLYFRYKNVFWAASSHQAPWKDMFFSGKYSDILVPAAEDTNSRTQDVNFSGRVGMLAGGFVNDYACRLVDDNPTSWRPLSPGGQRSVSPYLRNGALLAAYGSRYGILFNIGYLEDPGMNILFALMKSGALPMVGKDDMLSIGSWHLMQDVDEELVHLIDDGHTMKTYSKENENAVLSMASVPWCGASLPDYDYSKVALGVNYRWLNFIPEMPNGMVPIAPVEYAAELKKKNIPFTVSNTRHGIVDGQAVPAAEFGPLLGSTVKEGAAQLPVHVQGASWGAIRLDANHTRMVLIDQGYIDPQERTATLTFQTRQPKKAVDILSGEELPMAGKAMQVVVPAGSMRLIDLSY